MQKQYVIAHKFLPKSLNLSFFAVVWLLLDRFQPPGWVWGCVGTACALVFIALLVALIRQEEVDTPPWSKN